MKALTTLVIFSYCLILSLVGTVIISYALHLIQIQQLLALLELTYYDRTVRLSFGLMGALVILTGLYFAQLFIGKIQREKTIAFITPSGQVTISLVAVEDIIKKIGLHLYEIKELRPNVKATKKGVEINLWMVLSQETNIPELTARLQEMVKSRVQEILGVEETITVNIRVSKIAEDKNKDRKKKELVKEPVIPFQGYGSGRI